MKVLIADDDLVSRRLLQSYLQKWGYEVVAAADGNEAWRLFEADQFPLVITDWMMPGMDGPGLIGRIRASARARYVYTILLTARSEKEDVVAGMEAGADDFLSKPFDRDELRVRVRAGQRIIDLEQQLRETEAALAELRRSIATAREAGHGPRQGESPA
jgi:DNA-binding response OmpR family regulator